MKSKIQKTFSIPLTVVLKKLLKLPFKPFIERLTINKEKQIITEYLNNSNNRKINYFDLNFDIFFNKDTILNLSEIQNILSHKFDLLGSGVVSTAFNQKYPGFLGQNYSSPLNFLEFKEIINILPKEHKEKSKKIRNLISSNYQPIDWFVDIRSGYRWNLNYYKQIKYGNLDGVDIKVPWELSRLQHLFDLSLCNRLVDDNLKSIIKNEILNQILDFISLNPPFYGPNWVSPMEVSIRSVNIIFALIELQKHQNSEISEEITQYITNYLWSSYRFLQIHNEWNEGLRNNHFFANLLGLKVLSEIFEQSDKQNISKKIYDKFKTELRYQFFEDGGNFEGSIPYHFFTFEIVHWLSILYKDNLVSDKVISSKLSKILSFNKTFENHDINNLQIGDNDSGKILKFRCLSNFNYNCDYLSNNLIKYISNNEIMNKSKNIFENFGLVIVKRNNINLVISLGRNAQSGKGGHNHNDSKSFILSLDNVPFFVDPGTYTYTASPEFRNLYRSSQYHNKILEQDRRYFDKDLSSLFWCKDKLLKYLYRETEFEIILEINDNKLSPTRHYIIENNKVKIEDIIENRSTNLISSFHLHPDCIIQAINPKEIRITNSEKELHFYSSENFMIEDYFYSPEYGKIVKSNKIVISINTNKLNKISYLITTH